MEAHAAFESALPLIRIGSAVVERAHLFGQDLKPGKSRGLAKDSATLGCNTYIRSAVRNGELVAEAVEKDAASARGTTRTAFLKMARALRISREFECTDRKLKTIIAKTQPQRKRRCDDGFRHYRAENWSVRGAKIGSPEFIAEGREACSCMATLAE